MNLLQSLAVIAVFGTSFAGQQASLRDAATLQKSHPAATWNTKSAAVAADVTCDGQPDTIMFGSEKNNVLVGVVPGGHPEQIQVFTFPIRADLQDGFCASPTRILTAPLNCDTEGGLLEGCKPIKGCQEFTVNDDGCDPFNFYWDSSNQKLQWWRE